jgi:hypothetical protein
MRIGALLLLLVLACSTRENALPPEAWDVQSYVAAGVPDPARRWTHAEHVAAVQLLVDQSAQHPERLPRFGGARSGAVFARVIEPLVDDPGAPIEQRFGAHVQRYLTLNQLVKRYTKDPLAPPRRETIELFGALFADSVALEAMHDAFLASFPPDDPSLPARRGGFAKMATGWGGMLLGGFMTAGDLRVPEPDRIALVEHMNRALPTLFRHVAPDRQRAIREQIARLRELLDAGKLRDAIAVADQLVR